MYLNKKGEINMRPETWISPSRVKESWRKDTNIDWSGCQPGLLVEFFHRVFNYEIKEQDLNLINVPKVPHFPIRVMGKKFVRISKDSRHSFRRGFILMPKGISLPLIWHRLCRIESLEVIADSSFIDQVEYGCLKDRREEETYVIRYKGRGDENDVLDMTTENIRLNNIPTIRISEMLMCFLYNYCAREIFLDTFDIPTICPESSFYYGDQTLKYPRLQFFKDSKIKNVNGENIPTNRTGKKCYIFISLDPQKKISVSLFDKKEEIHIPTRVGEETYYFAREILA